MTTIVIAKDFSRTPAGRYHPVDGPYTGQRFRELMIAQLEHSPVLTIDLRETLGFPSSFLEEAFGGLVRAGMDYPDLVQRIRFVGEIRDQRYIEQIKDYMKAAKLTDDRGTR